MFFNFKIGDRVTILKTNGSNRGEEAFIGESGEFIGFYQAPGGLVADIRFDNHSLPLLWSCDKENERYCRRFKLSCIALEESESGFSDQLDELMSCLFSK